MTVFAKGQESMDHGSCNDPDCQNQHEEHQTSYFIGATCHKSPSVEVEYEKPTLGS